MLVFDCETRTDKAQALTFGSYRLFVARALHRRGALLRRRPAAAREAHAGTYVASHAAETDPRGIPEQGVPSDPTLHLLSLAEFRDKLYRVVPRAARCSLRSTFHLMSRLALNYPVAGPFPGRFQFHVLPVSGSGGHHASEPVSTDAHGQAHG